MTPEQESLERVLAEIFREVSTAARLADMAGLDVVQIDRTGSSADVWHSIVGMAIQDDALRALVERARVERPRNQELSTAWAAFQARQSPPTLPKQKRPPSRADRNYPQMSDAYRNEMRVDAVLREVADLRTVVAEVKTTMAYIANQSARLEIQNTKLEDKLNTVLRELEKQNVTARQVNKHNGDLPHDIKFYIAIAVAIIVVILVLSYFGGNIPR